MLGTLLLPCVGTKGAEEALNLRDCGESLSLKFIPCILSLSKFGGSTEVGEENFNSKTGASGFKLNDLRIAVASPNSHSGDRRFGVSHTRLSPGNGSSDGFTKE